MNEANKLAAIRSGDEITYHHDDKLERGIVEGWITREINGKPTKCVTLANSRLWVPVSAIVSRTRREGCGKGLIVFAEDAPTGAGHEARARLR